MESTSTSLFAVAGAAVPLAHFVYTLCRDFRRARRAKPRVRVFATTRRRDNGIGIAIPMKCVCVANVCGSPVSVVEVRTSAERGVGVIPVGGERHCIAPGDAIAVPLPADRLGAHPYCGDVFVELGSGDVFPAMV